MNKYDIWMPCNEQQYEAHIKNKINYKLLVPYSNSKNGLCLRDNALTFSSHDSYNYNHSHKLVDYSPELFIALSKVKRERSVYKPQVGDIIIAKEIGFQGLYNDKLLQIIKIVNGTYAYFDPIEESEIERKSTITAEHHFHILNDDYAYATLIEVCIRFNTIIFNDQNDDYIPIRISYY